jgi:hypothetical protein
MGLELLVVGGVRVIEGFRHSAIRASISDMISDLRVGGDSMGFGVEVFPFSRMGVRGGDAAF